MSTENVHTIHPQNTALPVHGANRVLREGSSVSVRVLSAAADGSYTVNVAGVRTTVQAKTALTPGSVFHAAVLPGKDGAILLKIENSPQVLTAGDAPQLLRQLSLNTEGVLTPELMSLFSAQGLVPDIVTLGLFRFLQQTGLRLDKRLLDRARSFAAAFPGKEEQASEAALMLLEKGVEPTKEAVARLLSSVEPYRDGAESTEERADSSKDSTRTDNAGDAVRQTERFIKDACSTEPGMLTLINQLPFRTESQPADKHWILVPFETDDAAGIIKLLLDLKQQTVEKVCISAQKCISFWNFVLLFQNTRIVRVEFCAQPEPAPEEIAAAGTQLAAALTELQSGISVSYTARAMSAGICITADSIARVDGTV